MATETFPIVSRRAARMKRRQKLQHIFAAGLLIATGVTHMRGEHHGVLPVLEVIAGALLLASVIYERVEHRSSHGVAWVEFAGAVMMFVEAFAKLQERHHLPIYVFAFLQPVVLLVFTLFDSQIAAMRRLTADEEGFRMRVRIWFTRTVRWRDVVSWTRTEHAFDVKLASGSTARLRFKDVESRDAAMDWTAAQFARRAGSAAQQLPGRDCGAEKGQSDQELVAAERGGD